jgi:predicted transcriptional regulator
MSEIKSSDELLRLTSQIVAAHVANNNVPIDELPRLIRQVHATLLQSLGGSSAPAVEEQRPAPAVPVKKSIMPDYIVCLEDGKKLKMLKRHLKTSYNMTPDQYRDRWNLPSDYPMVAPNYAKQRSNLAKEIGLGTKGRKA